MRSEGVYTRNDLASRFFGSRDTVSNRETKGKTRLTLSNSLALVKVNGTEFESNKVYCILSLIGDHWTGPHFYHRLIVAIIKQRNRFMVASR